ncbi:MAG: dihydrolipoyllysine-residue acetyltransferase [Gammaproteobacteria bacterium]|nr:dihydrolipoyllysine-residue acetyltransferase [Gammaproteobacteria bacterium]
MAQDIQIPDIGDADDVEVVEIIAAAGDEVGEDDPIIVIESDKASMEVPAGKAGVIDSITVSVGDKVSEGQVIAKLKDAEDSGSSGDDAGDDEASDKEAGDSDKKAQDKKAQEEKADKASSGKSAKSRQVEVRVPDIGDAEGVEVIEVAVKAGDTVAENDVLVVVESDKASMEIPSTHAGTVKEVHVSEGSEVEQDTLLVTLETEADQADEQQADEQQADEKPAAKDDKDDKDHKDKKDKSDKKSEKERQPKRAPERKPASGDRESRDLPPTAAPPSPPAHPPSSGTSVYAGPAVRRLARELGVDLQAVEGTGNRGRIVKDDVKTHVKTRMSGDGGAAAGALPSMPEVDFSKFGEVEEQPLSRIRARGAENLHRAWVNVPHVTQHDEVDITDLEDFRASLKAEGERRGVKVTPLAFIIKACCQVLQEFPTFNASLDPAAKKFILKRYYHIGMAVDTPDGLVVPVIRDADRKGVWELSAEVVELAEKARDKKLSVNDMQGGSFSVSSLGAIGGTGFTPIINAPEVAILGVSRLTTRPVWQDGAFVPRKMLPLSLSYDHRAINGAEAGRFVTRLGELLSDIRRLAL